MSSLKPVAMKRRSIAIGGLAGALAVVIAACADAPTSPSRSVTPTGSASHASSPPPTQVVKGLLWTKAVSEKTVSQTIGPAGGSLSIPAGIKVIVPKGAVSRPVTFSVTRIAGNVVAYDFQPHGTTFAVPIQIEQPTLGTNLMKQPAVKSISGAYFSWLNQASGTAGVTEFRPTFVAADKAWIKFTVEHFSGYMVSTGRDNEEF